MITQRKALKRRAARTQHPVLTWQIFQPLEWKLLGALLKLLRKTKNTPNKRHVQSLVPATKALKINQFVETTKIQSPFLQKKSKTKTPTENLPPFWFNFLFVVPPEEAPMVNRARFPKPPLSARWGVSVEVHCRKL